jgi:N-acetyltransferase
MHRTCKECGMEYVPANKEDAALHNEYHGMNIHGVDLGKGFVKEVGTLDMGRRLTKFNSLSSSVKVAMTDRNASLAARKSVQRVLEVVHSDLGAVEIVSEELWGTIGTKAKSKSRVSGVQDGQEPKYKVFLCIIGRKCVGLCLAERIYSAGKVVISAEDVKETLATKHLSVMVSATKDSALLGISRIWTSKGFRALGVASKLLDLATCNFFYGITVPKEMVAFSEPTESGKALAEKWYEANEGWHVYGNA